MPQRLKGQEISIRVLAGGNLLSSIDSISTFNDNVDLELKQAGYLGEFVNRFDEVLNGFGGDFQFHTTNARWNELQSLVIARATRKQPDLVFNVVRTDLYPNGDSTIYTYEDVFWGAQPTAVASRGDYVQVSASFGTSNRSVQNNQLP